MKCLVINLDRSVDRLAHMTAEFARIGIEFERVAAVDARYRPDLDLQPHYASYAPQHVTSSEVACLHSHRACWMIIAQGEACYGAVFEDDIIFSANAGILLACAGWIPADADIVKIETFFKRTSIHRKRISVGHGFSMFRLCNIHLGTGGYIISRQAARDLLAATEMIKVAVDHVMFNPAFPTSSSKAIYQLFPALCAQDQFLGDIAVGLPSLLSRERNAKTRRRPAGEKIRIEIGRIVDWIIDFCKLRRQMTIPMASPRPQSLGDLTQRAHTQRRENTL
ncbi:glycosyltransferase family 25 protein [Mesorhizobium sp. ESP6-5]|uniref:glycosyltransferase family 25 protein n=1 Tax=unclassified Mesorhizobium TaxID=325217 RepID=UPI00112EF77A|nr:MULTISPECIES: glycosyltransferase family 25 protein [unclassified Mesorhizobium]MBZ9754742.1 glycosyltransferase family 25 protein [Mesorhizobium sp. ESP6-5]MBZ9910350.1 glycosyltransferase family 25 protein [Mesorhizobium sp. BR115XR7A]MBZ9929427.1 glycosyltransferase family 25 protein [Mesorhizobium sp. BR1-1-5]TPK80690.1 glycosyltransferase family 25 protein [Mesorhizobium sp. B2-4-18]